MNNQPSVSTQQTTGFSQWYHQNIFFWELLWVIVRWLILIGMLVGFAFIGGWLFESRPPHTPPNRPQTLTGLGSNSNVIAFSQDSSTLVTSSSDATIRYWNVQTSSLNPDSVLIQGQESNLVTSALSPSSRWLAVSGNNHEIWLFDRFAQGVKGEPVILKGHQNPVTRLVFSSDENWLVSGGEDNTIRLWNLAFRPVENIAAVSILLTGNTKPISALAVSPNSRWLASGSQDGIIRLWDLSLNQTPEQLVLNSIILSEHKEHITDLVFSPTGRWLASSSLDNTLLLWDVFAPDPANPTASPIPLTGYRGDVVDLEFSPHGHWLVTASTDKTVRLWNMNLLDIPGQTPLVLRGFRAGVTSVAITADQRWLVTTSADKRVRLWSLTVQDISDQDPIVLRNHRGRVIASAVSPNGQRVATVDDRNTILVWDLSTIRPPALSLFNDNSLRYIIAPLAAFIGIMISAALYVEDIYNLPAFNSALQFVFSSVLGIRYPQLIIDNGKAILRKGEINLLKAVGGPGFVLIQPGNAAFFRYLRRPTGARINRYVFLGPFETLGAIVNLDDQDGFVESWQCTTKDGIPVELRDIHFRFRVRYIKGMHRTMDNPYPIDPQALLQRGTNITVNERGPIPWEDSVRMAVTTIITEYIQKNTIDYLTAPRRSREDPRSEFRNYVLEKARVQRSGAELLWIEVGHFHILDDKVEETRIDAWALQQRGMIEQQLARSEADQKILRELGRAEGQAEIIKSIANALGEAQLSTNKSSNIQRIFLARVAQIIDNMESSQGPDPNNPNVGGKGWNDRI